MEAGDLLSARLRKSTHHDEIESGVISLASPLEVQTPEHPSVELRSAVERQFTRMNEAHDRIRTKLLCSDSDTAK